MKRILSVFLMISLFLLGGCKEQVTDYSLEVPMTTEATTASATEPSTAEATQLEEYREYATYPLEGPSETAVGNLYYDTYSSVIRYYDTELRREVTLCSQPNCTHSDPKCIAYLGGNIGNGYRVKGDMVYVVVEDTGEGGELLFIERNMITGESRTLWDMTPSKGIMRQNVLFSIYRNVAFLTFREYELQWNENGTSYEKDPTQYSYELDLATGERELLVKAEIPVLEGFCFNGDQIIPQACTEDYLVVMDVEYREEVLLPVEEYLKANPEGDYGRYILENYQRESHYSINRKTGERKRLCSGVVEAAMRDRACIRDRKTAFLDENTVWIFEGHTGEVTPCLEQENVVMLMCFDGRIFYNTKEIGEDSTPIWHHYWYDLQTGEKKEYQIGSSSMSFSIHGEMTDYFYGTGEDGRHFISKQDFYNENYDAAF